ncbi:hypothetical protein R1flu_012523 [Riccia fluitans]|uniref:Uncharacterized protein n=1 Tax=Riccia fluitans TaxID=41844 RepID=A0ABD1ZAZ7_9MARC
MELRFGKRSKSKEELPSQRKRNANSLRRGSGSNEPPPSSSDSNSLPSSSPEVNQISQPQPTKNFRPQPGDIIIRNKLQTASTAKVISALNLVRIYRDDKYHVDQTEGNFTEKFKFHRGDQILRAGGFTPSIWQWTYEENPKLFIFWPIVENSGNSGEEVSAWFEVAQNDNTTEFEPTNDTNRETSAEFQGPILSNRDFKLCPGDYVVHGASVNNCDGDLMHRPWGKTFEVRTIPRNYDDREQWFPAYYGPGDVVVRIRVANPWPGGHANVQVDGSHPFAPMFVYGFLCLGGHTNRVFYRWRYMGMDHNIFRSYELHTSNSSTRSKRVDRSPAQPGDIVFNLDERLHEVSSKGPGWTGGHVILHRDGQIPEPSSDRIPGSMVLRLGSFPTSGPKSWSQMRRDEGASSNNPMMFSVWGDVPVELFVQDQISDLPGSWIQEVSDGPEVGGIYPPALTGFPEQFADPQNIQLGDSPVILQPRPTDLILSREVWADHLKLIYGYRAAPDKEDCLMTTEVGGGYVRVNRPRNLERKLNVFFWYKGYEFRDQDCLFRFGSEPCDAEAGSWILSIELYTFSLMPEKWRIPQSVYRGEWALRGRDLVVYQEVTPSIR